MAERTRHRSPRPWWYPRITWVAGLSTLAVSVASPDSSAAQQESSQWHRNLLLETRIRYDDNVFRLSRSQRAVVSSGSTSDRFQDMGRVDDVVVRVKLGGEFRGRSIGSRPVRVGAGIKVDAFTFNSRLTNVSLESFLTQSMTSRDEITLELDYEPDQFRRNYLTGEELAGVPAYGAGVANQAGARLRYERKLREGKGRDLNLELSAAASRRSYADFSWRDRTRISGAAGLQMEIGQRVRAELRVARSQGEHDGAPEPFLEANQIQIMPLNRDFNDNELGAEVRVEVRRRTDVLVGWERRVRHYVAFLGQDPVYGGRRDNRDGFEFEMRYDPAGPFEWRAGGLYRYQETFRPAGGDTTEEEDYRQTRLFVTLRYHR